MVAQKGIRPTNLAFIRIPKTAGTTISSVLGLAGYGSPEQVRAQFNQTGWVHFSHMDYAALIKQGYVNKDFDETAFKFSFVRNPYDRAVSLYFYLHNYRIVKADGSIVPRREAYISSFLQFAKMLAKRKFAPIGLYAQRSRSIFNPQVRWTEKVDLDFLGRFERLNQDVKKLANAVGISVKNPLPRMRASRHDPYSTYYCDESRKIVEDLYGEDFERFGYCVGELTCRT